MTDIASYLNAIRIYRGLSHDEVLKAEVLTITDTEHVFACKTKYPPPDYKELKEATEDLKIWLSGKYGMMLPEWANNVATIRDGIVGFRYGL